jgi:hypothetical protein
MLQRCSVVTFDLLHWLLVFGSTFKCLDWVICGQSILPDVAALGE